MNAANQIREDLRREQRVRTLKTALAGIVLAGIAGGFLFLHPVSEHQSPTGYMAAAIAAAFALYALVATRSPNIGLGRFVVVGLAVVAILTPWLAVRAFGDGAASWGCALTVAGVGTAAVVAMRLALLGSARRFGGATILYGLAAGLTAQFSVGLHCPMATALHIGTHILALSAVVFVVAQVAFWRPSKGL